MGTRQALAAVEDEKDDPQDTGVSFRPCPLCRGRGRMEVVVDRDRPRQVVLRPCIVCRGHGYVRLTRTNTSSNTVPS